MAEEKIFFQQKDLRIEGLLSKSPREEAVIVTHPHPLYGGDMHNNVVESIVEAYQQEGYTTLRFNFRGVGQSEGRYDDGTGEQEDVRAALGCLLDAGKTSIDLAGYSFGAWVNALGIKALDQVRRMIMISPPVNFMDFSFLEYSPKIRLVIGASGDDIGPPVMIKKMLPTWNPEAELHIIKGADHFYWGKAGEIKEIISSFLKRV